MISIDNLPDGFIEIQNFCILKPGMQIYHTTKKDPKKIVTALVVKTVCKDIFTKPNLLQLVGFGKFRGGARCAAPVLRNRAGDQIHRAAETDSQGLRHTYY